MTKRVLALATVFMMLLTSCSFSDEKMNTDNLDNGNAFSILKLDMGERYVENGYTDEAIEKYKDFIDENPYEIDAWIGLSNAYLENDSEYSIKMFDEWDKDYEENFSDKDLDVLNDYLEETQQYFDDKAEKEREEEELRRLEEEEEQRQEEESANSQSQKTIVINTWNDEFKNLFEDYYLEDHPLPDGYTYEINITPNTYDNGYQMNLDEDLLNQDSADMKLDLFLVESDYILKYANTIYTMDLKQLGLTDEDFENMYPYTLQYGTNQDGELKAVSWQASPGCFVYNRRIAKEIFGTDDPDKIGALISDWDKFYAAADKVCASGEYRMLSSYEGAYRAYCQNKTTPWVDNDSMIQIDPCLEDWAKTTKKYVENGNFGDGICWYDDGRDYSNTFGAFWPTWGLTYCLPEYTENLSDTWACCAPPADYFWGGSYLCAAAGGDNDEIVLDIIKYCTTDTNSMVYYNEQIADFPNNTVAANNIDGSSYTLPLYENQEYYPILDEVASNINIKNITPYDMALNEEFQVAMEKYIVGECTYEQAVDSFYENAITRNPCLKRPN